MNINKIIIIISLILGIINSGMITIYEYDIIPNINSYISKFFLAPGCINVLTSPWGTLFRKMILILKYQLQV